MSRQRAFDFLSLYLPHLNLRTRLIDTMKNVKVKTSEKQHLAERLSRNGIEATMPLIGLGYGHNRATSKMD